MESGGTIASFRARIIRRGRGATRSMNRPGACSRGMTRPITSGRGPAQVVPHPADPFRARQRPDRPSRATGLQRAKKCATDPENQRKKKKAATQAVSTGFVPEERIERGDRAPAGALSAGYRRALLTSGRSAISRRRGPGAPTRAMRGRPAMTERPAVQTARPRPPAHVCGPASRPFGSK
jgi:hypothetical protein